MKNVTIKTQSGLGRAAWQPPLKQTQTNSNRTLLLGLMIPSMAVILHITMFGVVLPTMREHFQIGADVVGWLVTVFMLPFMIAMPLYGRLGDELGKRRLFLVGMIAFLLSTLLTFIATDLWLLMLGRVIQGLGSASTVPLSMAIISQRFLPHERGKALGTWNSVGPITGIAGPLLAGFLIDYVGWRAIYIPIFGVSLLALWVIKEKIPHRHQQADFKVLYSFDWGGVLLLTFALTLLTFYLSSPTITGVAALLDWRLLLLATLFFAAFIVHENRCQNPYINLSIFSNSIFSWASLGAGVRMFLMGGIIFLIPLYLVDIYNLSAVAIGLVFTMHSVALLVTMRIGGQLADRWNSRGPVIVGSCVQLGSMMALAMLAATASLWWVMVWVLAHGLGAGLSLAPFHRASLGQVVPEEAGMAAGVYSMIRFTGTMLGPVIGGVILQQGLDLAVQPISAYHTSFWLFAAVGMLGVISGLGLRE